MTLKWLLPVISPRTSAQMLNPASPVNLYLHGWKQQTVHSINSDRLLFYTSDVFTYSKSPPKAAAQKWHSRRAMLPEGTRWQNVNVLCHISINTAFHKVYYSILSVIEMFMMLLWAHFTGLVVGFPLSVKINLFHLLLNLLKSSINWFYLRF